MRYALMATLALGLATSHPALAQEASGNRAFRRGDLEEAAERYRNALEGDEEDTRVHYNLGSTLLRLGESEAALEELRRGLEGREPELRTRAFYNLGNALVAQAGSDQETLERAVEAYRRALLLDPENGDAKWNLELALRRLEQLQSQSMQQPQSQQPPQEDEDGEQDDGAQPPPTGSGSSGPQERPPQRQLPGDLDEPLPRELAEQILKAVEERERELQREKMRKSPARRSGPDW